MDSHQSDPIEQFLTSDPRQRLELARDPALAEPLTALLGPDALHELQALAQQAPSTAHLADQPVNLLFLPGVMGSVLASQGRGGVWWIDPRTRDRIDDLRLSPDGCADIDTAFRITPVVVDPSYDAFYVAVGKRVGFGYQGFHYDWRKPLAASTDGLRECVLDTHAANGGRPVHLVAHSMGGLLIRTTLCRHPELWRHVGKVVFLATPHYGSPAVAGYLKNHLWGLNLFALLGRYLSRETFRSMWGVLSLLPAPVGVYPGTRPGDPAVPGEPGDYPHPCANFDLYNAADWRLDRLSTKQRQQLQTVLSAADAAHRELYAWHQALEREQRDRMAVIAGVGYQTLFRLAYRRRFGHDWNHMSRVTTRTLANRHREGDGRVPLASAALEDVGELRYVRAEHAKLPNVRDVTSDVLRFLADQPMRLPRSPTAALEGHLGDASPPPTLPGAADDDPGYLDFAPPSPAALAVLQSELEGGRLPSFDLLHIL